MTEATRPGPGDTIGPRPPLAFGPVRSRRLGWSLGVNNVPPKTCSYACVYCQVGATDRASVEPGSFNSPGEIVAAVRERLAACAEAGQAVDYATFVPDGEPTLDLGLGDAIRGIRALGVRTAVITNGSLLWRAEVRAALVTADLVSLKVDTVDESIWRRLNRPVRTLRLGAMLDGVRQFSAGYSGELVTETMLVAGLNDEDSALQRTAALVARLAPRHAYLAVPTRPPAEGWVRAPAHARLHRALDIFRTTGIPVATLSQEVPDSEAPFAAVGDPAEGLLGIVAVHPMRLAAVRDYLHRAGADWSVAQGLIDSGRLIVVRHGRQPYLRAARTTRRPRGPISCVRPPEC